MKNLLKLTFVSIAIGLFIGGITLLSDLRNGAELKYSLKIEEKDTLAKD